MSIRANCQVSSTCYTGPIRRGRASAREVQSAREAFWRTRFRAAGDLAREALNGGRSATGAEVGAFIERLIGPLFLRAFITGVPINDAFIRAIVRAALGPRDGSERRRGGRAVTAVRGRGDGLEVVDPVSSRSTAIQGH